VGELTALPRPANWIREGPTSKGMEWNGREGEGEGKKKKGDGLGRGRKRGERCVLAFLGWTPLCGEVQHAVLFSANLRDINVLNKINATDL